MNPTNLGWIAPKDRTGFQIAVDETIQSRMPLFGIRGFSDAPTQSLLYKFIKDHKPFYQETGSCVGCGLGMALWCLESVEVNYQGQLEDPICPFWLLPYGKSREIAGMFGRGEGSFGSAAIEAIQRYGTLQSNFSGVPKYEVKDGALVWGEQAEMNWSDGTAIKQSFLDIGKKYIVKTAARITSVEEAKAALINGYPLTCASNWGGEMNPKVQGKDPKTSILLNRRVTTWGHQMCCLGWMMHPEFKDVFYIQNSWGNSFQGSPKNFDETDGGFWISAKDMQWIIKDGEVFAISNFAGFPARKLDWYI